jgi:hypothetical protein
MSNLASKQETCEKSPNFHCNQVKQLGIQSNQNETIYARYDQSNSASKHKLLLSKPSSDPSHQQINSTSNPR